MGPADLARAQAFRIHKLMKVIMVNEDKDLVFAVFQVVAPSLKGFNDSQELLIIGLVLRLSGNHFSKEKGYWMLLANFKQ